MDGTPTYYKDGRRSLLRATAVALGAGLGTSTAVSAIAASEGASSPSGIRAFRLYTGADKASHVAEGTVDQHAQTDVVTISFRETPPHSFYQWHDDPEPQYVITLSGTLEFTTRDGETFILRPGDILLAEDHVGSGHKWRLIDGNPWRRAYVVLKPGTKTAFVPRHAG